MALVNRHAQLEGQKALLRFARWNPLGANLAIGPLMTVIALSYGASDLQTGLMYAGVNLGGIVVLILPLLFGGLDASAVYWRAWLLRSLLGVAYLSLPLLGSNAAKVWLIVAVYMGFMAARAIGVAAGQVVIKALSRPVELPQVVAQQATWWHVGTIAISLITAGILNRTVWFPSQEWTFMTILTAGIVLNFCATAALKRIPPTGALPRGSPLSVLACLPKVVRDHEQREVIVLTLLTVPMGIAAGYTLNYLKLGLMMSAEVVFAVSIGSMLAMLAGSYLSGIVGRSIGFRTLQFGAHAALALCGLLLALNSLWPAHLQVPMAIAVSLMTSLCTAVSANVLGALSIDRLGEKHRLETSILFQLTATVAAGLGLLIMALARHTGLQAIPGTHLYSHACLVWTLFSLAVCWASLRLRRPGDQAWGDMAVFLPSNLVSAMRLHQVEHSKDPMIERMHDLEHVLSNGTPASRQRQLQYLQSPDVAHRLSAYRALYIDPVPAVAPLVLAEALNGESPIRAEAITALGFLANREVVPGLMPLLEDASLRVASATFKTLSRLGEVWAQEAVLAYWSRWSEPDSRMDLLIGLSATRQCPLLWRLARKVLEAEGSGDGVRLVLLNLAEALGERDEICEIWASERKTGGSGVAYVLDELQDQPGWQTCTGPQARGDSWRQAVARRLAFPPLQDDATAASLLYLASRDRSFPAV